MTLASDSAAIIARFRPSKEFFCWENPPHCVTASLGPVQSIVKNHAQSQNVCAGRSFVLTSTILDEEVHEPTVFRKEIAR